MNGVQLENLCKHFKNKGFSKSDIAKKISVTPQYFTEMLKDRMKINTEILEKILDLFPDINPEWLLTGKGEMLRGIGISFPDRNLVPLYDDAGTMGGNHGKTANMDGVNHPTEYIDTGDWFTDATAAIRHYGESMVEYPEGCILAVKEVQDKMLVVPGRDYVVETDEYRVTKRLQKSKNNKSFDLYSTNTDTYPDGRLIHEPFEVPIEAIRRLSLVLGYVVKKNGGTMVFSKAKK